MTFGFSAEIFVFILVFDHNLVAAALQRHIERGQRVALSCGKAVAGDGNAHGNGNRHIVVSEPYSADGVEYVKVAPDTVRKHPAREKQNIFESLIFAQYSSHSARPFLEYGIHLRRLRLVVEGYVLCDLVEVVKHNVGDGGGIADVSGREFPVFGHVVENKHIIERPLFTGKRSIVYSRPEIVRSGAPDLINLLQSCLPALFRCPSHRKRWADGA